MPSVLVPDAQTIFEMFFHPIQVDFARTWGQDIPNNIYSEEYA